MGKLNPEEVKLLIKTAQISREHGITKGANVKEICGKAGVSRKTGYKWVNETDTSKEEEGKFPYGSWITFRELTGGASRYVHFQQRCEKPLKRIADTYTDLFKNMLEIFDGKQIVSNIDSDISIVLYPLPLFPIMVCYWKPEDGLESILHIYFDSTSDDNLDIESIYTLSEGVALMFEKISLRHGA